jgi:hypothetical protein
MMVYRELPWALVRGIAVCNDAALARVEGILNQYPPEVRKPVAVRAQWYF